ncbi:DUF2905 domain-containing protein [Gluconacetobacter tumulisoli]|uniref:DUF2905 domain-containing protein n=1 Tax=Gluconacetobacter tumulisoli TaxID=1286189 RepID=A0A7W4PLA3_9PROT|nr:DUF2905 domain-containing protein [Gluconacetobacter tumulisoli]MBB2201593.1 DUF2905 domain-containing protein [Gluconacetobacter tumulisoli]
MSKSLIAVGVALVLAGMLWPFLARLPLGRLPGDIVIQRPNFTFYALIATCVVISVVLSLILWLIRR